MFDDHYKGEEARAALHRMAGEGRLKIKDTVNVVKKPDGKTLGQKAGHIAGLVAAASHRNSALYLAGTLAGNWWPGLWTMASRINS